jgi:hypothetical protein
LAPPEYHTSAKSSKWVRDAPILPIFSDFNPAQKSCAIQIAQFLNCQVLLNVSALRAGNYHLTILFEHNGPLGQLLSVLAPRAGPF